MREGAPLHGIVVAAQEGILLFALSIGLFACEVPRDQGWVTHTSRGTHGRRARVADSARMPRANVRARGA
eukprot:2460157-Prymnesium_polylepis.1